jgi:hypothetical protein
MGAASVDFENGQVVQSQTVIDGTKFETQAASFHDAAVREAECTYAPWICSLHPKVWDPFAAEGCAVATSVSYHDPHSL